MNEADNIGDRIHTNPIMVNGFSLKCRNSRALIKFLQLVTHSVPHHVPHSVPHTLPTQAFGIVFCNYFIEALTVRVAAVCA